VTIGNTDQSVTEKCASSAGLPSHCAHNTDCEVDMPVPISAPL
jgi:hypothetical protein